MELSKADQIQISFYRKLSGEARVKIASELGEISLNLMENGIRDAHPDWSDDQVRLSIISRLIPETLFKRAYPNAHLH